MATAETCATCRHLQQHWSPYLGEMRVHYHWCHRRYEQRCQHDAACQDYARKGEYPIGGPKGHELVDTPAEYSIVGQRRESDE